MPYSLRIKVSINYPSRLQVNNASTTINQFVLSYLATMTELDFTKPFLSLLDLHPTKLSADHVFDAEIVGLRIPVLRVNTHPA